MHKLNRIILFLIFAISFTSLAFAKDLNLTLLYDNNPYNEELETRWGFSCLVEGLEKTILFDVGGEGSVLLKNMKRLEIAPEIIDIIVLSHIHYDHIGGLFNFLEENCEVCVYLPRSFPRSIKDNVKEAGAELVEVHSSIEICENAYSTGELGRWIKEQSLIIKTSKGLIVITGCAHPGIVKIVEKAKEALKTNVYLVLGGFHLSGMTGLKIKGKVNGMKKEEVKKVAPCHCSGDLARELFEKAYGKDFICAGVWKKIKVTDAF